MQKNAPLTSQQIEHFEDQGYLLCEQAFEPPPMMSASTHCAPQTDSTISAKANSTTALRPRSTKSVAPTSPTHSLTT